MDPHEIIAKLGMFWPMGDPGQLRQARDAYRQCAGDIGTVQAACQSSGSQVQAGNQGPPIDGFAAWLAKWQSDPGYFPATISACNQLADACDAYAQRIEESHRRIIELAVAAAAALAVGLALTVFTFGGSDAAAGVTIAGLVAASLAEGTALSTAAAGIVVAIGVGAIEGMVFDGVIQVEAISFDGQKGFNWGEFGQSAGFGALTGGLGFGAGSLTTRVGSRLLPTLVDASPAAARTLNALGRIPGPVRGGLTGMLAGGGFAAGMDQLTTGHVNPQDVLIGTLAGGAGGAIGGRSRPIRSESANSISNIGEGANAQNALTLGSARPGDAFSGVYDPATGTFSSYPSVPNANAYGAPANAVRMLGGHGDINEAAFAKSRNTVAFTAFVENGGSISIGWRSRSVNLENHGMIGAPFRYREAIMQAIADATGRIVWSRD
jgi:hypothetical protein